MSLACLHCGPSVVLNPPLHCGAAGSQPPPPMGTQPQAWLWAEGGWPGHQAGRERWHRLTLPKAVRWDGCPGQAPNVQGAQQLPDSHSRSPARPEWPPPPGPPLSVTHPPPDSAHAVQMRRFLLGEKQKQMSHSLTGKGHHVGSSGLGEARGPVGTA